MAGVPSPTAPRAEAVRLVGRPAPVRDLAELVAEVAPAGHARLGVRHAALARGAAERRGSRGIPAADPGRLPAGDSSGHVPSTWQETAVPSRAAQGRGPRLRWAPCARAGTCPGTPRRPPRTP